MSADYKQLKDFARKVEQMADKEEFLQACVNELAARLLRKVIKTTPVGGWTTDEDGNKVRIEGYVGGTLRRGWTVKTEEEAKNGVENSVQEHLSKNVSIEHRGNQYILTLINPVEYASYVEYGHRKRGGKGWVNGRHMLTISEKEINASAPKILEAKLNNWLKDSLK